MEIKSSPASTYTTTTATTAITKTTTTLTVQIAVATPTITTVPTKSTLPTPTTTITTTASTKAFQNPLKVPKNNQNQDPSYTDANSLSTLDIVVIAVSGCILVAVIIGLVVPCYIWRKRIYKRLCLFFSFIFAFIFFFH